MEHVGKHYEKEGAGQEEEEIDEDLVEWGVRTGVLKVLSDGKPWLVSVEDPNGGDTDGANNDLGNGSGRGRALTGSANSEEKDRKKARRQPSRTVVRERRVSFENEDGDTIEVSFG